MDNSSLLVTIGLRVRTHRKALKLSQEKLAEHCGLFRTYLSRIEGGVANPTVLALASLADALGIDIAVLLRNPE